MQTWVAEGMKRDEEGGGEGEERDMDIGERRRSCCQVG